MPDIDVKPAPPEHLKASGRLFWGRVFDALVWVTPDTDITLITMTAELLDERHPLIALVDREPENAAHRGALRALDRQLAANLSLLGLTPSDRARLGQLRTVEQAAATIELEQLLGVNSAWT